MNQIRYSFIKSFQCSTANQDTSISYCYVHIRHPDTGNVFEVKPHTLLVDKYPNSVVPPNLHKVSRKGMVEISYGLID